MPGERYFGLAERLLTCGRWAEELARDAGLEGEVDAEGLFQELARPLRIVALGEVNAGKSTLLNALAGDPDLCPAGPLPTTMNTTLYVRLDAAQDHDADGWPTVGTNSDFLRRFELVDTPGTTSEARERLVEDLPRVEVADLLMMVFPADNTWTAASWQLLEMMGEEALGATVLVVQQADRKSQEDLRVIRGHMRDLCQKKTGYELPIFTVSAKTALERGRDEGLADLQAFVAERVCGSPERDHRLRRTTQWISRRLREIEEGLDRQRRGMDDDGWFVAELEREAMGLRDRVLEAAPKAMAMARERYEAEVMALSRALRRTLGPVRTAWRLFVGDVTPARVEGWFAEGLQRAIADFAKRRADALLFECSGHWNELRPRIQGRMGLDPGDPGLIEEEGVQAKSQFGARLGRAAPVIVGQLRVRALLDGLLRRRNRQLKLVAGVALAVLALAGTAGTIAIEEVAWGLLAGGIGLILLWLLAACLTRRSAVAMVREHLLDSKGRFETLLRDEYAVGVRELFRDYASGLIGVKRQLADRKSTLAPRSERCDALFLELKTIEQELG